MRGVRRATGDDLARTGPEAAGPSGPVQVALDPETSAVGGADDVDPAQPVVTDAEALVALAQDALAAEASRHPAVARTRRLGLTAQVDPLSGWARLRDGEVLPPSSLTAVVKALPGRGAEARLRRLTDLVLVCARHHTLIHRSGFELELHPDRRLTVRTADGALVLPHPAQPWGDPAALAAGCGRLVFVETVQPDHADARLHLRYVVSVVMAQAA